MAQLRKRTSPVACEASHSAQTRSSSSGVHAHQQRSSSEASLLRTGQGRAHWLGFEGAPQLYLDLLGQRNSRADAWRLAIACCSALAHTAHRAQVHLWCTAELVSKLSMHALVAAALMPCCQHGCDGCWRASSCDVPQSLSTYACGTWLCAVTCLA